MLNGIVLQSSGSRINKETLVGAPPSLFPPFIPPSFLPSIPPSPSRSVSLPLSSLCVGLSSPSSSKVCVARPPTYASAVRNERHGRPEVLASYFPHNCRATEMASPEGAACGGVEWGLCCALQLVLELTAGKESPDSPIYVYALNYALSRAILPPSWPLFIDGVSHASPRTADLEVSVVQPARRELSRAL